MYSTLTCTNNWIDFSWKFLIRISNFHKSLNFQLFATIVPESLYILVREGLKKSNVEFWKRPTQLWVRLRDFKAQAPKKFELFLLASICLSMAAGGQTFCTAERSRIGYRIFHAKLKILFSFCCYYLFQPIHTTYCTVLVKS